MVSVPLWCTRGWFWLSLVFIEVLHSSNEELARFFLSGPQGGIPRGVSARNVYAFAPMPPAELAQHMHAGRAVAEDEIRRRGAVAPGAGALAPAGDAPPAGAEDHDQSIWVLHDCLPGKKIGEEVAVPIDAPRMGDRALVRVIDSGGNSSVVRGGETSRIVSRSSCKLSSMIGPSCPEHVRTTLARSVK